VLPAWRLRGARVDLAVSGRAGTTGETQRAWSLRLIGSHATGTRSIERPVYGVVAAGVPTLDRPTAVNAPREEAVRPLALRVEADARYERPMPHGLSLVASVQGGVTTGRDLPPQWLQFAGGPWSGPGYAFHAFAGRAIASPRLELRVPVPFPSVSLGKYGKAPARAQLAPFTQVVLLGGASSDPRVAQYTNGVYPAVGLGVLLFYDLLRVDVARGVHQGGWRFSIDVDRAFWGIL
jgi:hypothetical protein